jgi:hypothetical protein
MFRRSYFSGLLLGLLAILSTPGVVSAQFMRPTANFFYRPPTVYNGLAMGYLNNSLAARAVYNNAYLNTAIGNAFAFNARADRFLFNNALLTNPAQANAFNQSYINNLTNATQFYTAGYLNRAVGNSLVYNAQTNAALYQALTPNVYFNRVNNFYNPYTGQTGYASLYANPYGAFYNVNTFNRGYYNPYAIYTPYSNYSPVNPYAYVGYPVTYNPAAYVNPYTFYNPFYANPYPFVSPAYANPYTSLYFAAGAAPYVSSYTPFSPGY